MTTKEKAKELVDIFIPYNQEYQEGTDMEFSDDLEGAKQCALICVNKILEAVTTTADKKYDFYTEVKQEIEKL